MTAIRSPVLLAAVALAIVFAACKATTPAQKQLDAINDTIASKPDAQIFLRRAEVYEERGEHEKALADVDRAAQIEVTESWKPGHPGRAYAIHDIRAKAYRALIARTEGQPEQARYKELAAKNEEDYAVENAIERQRDVVRAAAARQPPPAAAPRRAAGPSEYELKRQRQAEQRVKGIAEHGACDGCNGSGEITWQAPGTNSYQPTTSGIGWKSGDQSRTVACERCRGTGFRGSDYSSLREAYPGWLEAEIAKKKK